MYARSSFWRYDILAQKKIKYNLICGPKLWLSVGNQNFMQTGYVFDLKTCIIFLSIMFMYLKLFLEKPAQACF